jgi:hypothetical protein
MSAFDRVAPFSVTPSKFVVPRVPRDAAGRRQIRQTQRRVCRFELLEPRIVLATVTVHADPFFLAASERGPAPAVFRFERDGDISAPLTVNYSYTGGSATPGVDFQVFETSVTFEASAGTAYTSVLPFNDSLNEFQETIRIALSPSPNYTVGSNSSAMVPLENVYVSGFPGVFDLSEPGLPGDLFYLDATISGGVLTIILGISNVNFSNPTSFEVFIDADQTPLTGDPRQGFVRNAEYNISGQVFGLGDFFQLFRLPTEPQQEPNLLGQDSITNLGNGFFRHANQRSFDWVSQCRRFVCLRVSKPAQPCLRER